jgi:hypothetical protein
MREQRAAVEAGPVEGKYVTAWKCDLCGAVVQNGDEDTTAYGRWAAVRFCDQCVRARSAAEIRYLRCEIALRGVPFS